jgi:hypothetical protein
MAETLESRLFCENGNRLKLNGFTIIRAALVAPFLALAGKTEKLRSRRVSYSFIFADLNTSVTVSYSAQLRRKNKRRFCSLLPPRWSG